MGSVALCYRPVPATTDPGDGDPMIRRHPPPDEPDTLLVSNDVTRTLQHVRWRLCIDPANSLGETPLLCACRRGLDSVAEVLIKFRANVNHVNDDLETPLTAALGLYSSVELAEQSSERKLRLVRLLLEGRADANLHRWDVVGLLLGCYWRGERTPICTGE